MSTPLISRRGALLLGVSATSMSLLGMAACSASPNSSTVTTTGGIDQSYVAGNGAIEYLGSAQRGEPITLAGETLDGKQWDATQQRGKFLIINVWGAWCGPCQMEAPELEKAWQQILLDGVNVEFMGLNQRDSVEGAQAALKSWGATFPSLRDNGGRGIIALQGKVVATPTTLIIDRKGRIAGRITGATTASTVRGLLDDVMENEKSSENPRPSSSSPQPGEKSPRSQPTESQKSSAK